MQKLSRSFIALGGLFALAACGDDVSITQPAEVPIKVTSVTVAPTNVNLAVGEKVSMSASVALSAGTGTAPVTTVGWTIPTASPAIASVDAAGVVTGASVGQTTVRATSTADASIVGAASVTVTSGILGVSFQPSALSLGLGSAFTLGATVQKVAASTSASTVNYTVAPAGILTLATAAGVSTITAVAAGTAVVTATSSADATKSAQMTVTVTALPVAVTSLSVAPTSASLAINDTLRIIPSATFATGATATSITYGTNNSAVASIAAGKVTAVAPGTAVITVVAKGTVTVGTATRTDSLVATSTITVGARASVSIASLTFVNGAGNEVAVNLAGVFGQVEANLNINSGAERVEKVEVFINGALSAAQTYGINGAPNAPIQLSINTAEFDASYVPKYLNGPATIQAKIYPAGASNPTASNSIPFTLTNADVVYFNATGQTHSSPPGVAGVGGTWWKGGYSVSSFPVNYSGAIASVTYAFTATGPTGTCTQTSGGTAGPNFVGTFSCAGVEAAGHNAVQGVTVTYPASYTLTAAPTLFMTAASAGFVPGKPQWTATNYNSREDNVGPSVSAVAFANGLTAVAGDNWAGSPTTWSATATDAGVGMTATPSATAAAQTDASNDGGTTVGFPNIANPLSLAETLTGSAAAPNYRVSGAPATDLLGNTGGRGVWSAYFGVDLQVLDAEYADRTNSALATIFPLTAKGTIYAEAAPSVINPSWTVTRDGATEVVAVDAIDTRSGLDNPNAQVSSLVRRTASGSSSCASGASNMSTILVDNYVQTTTPAQLDCGLAAGSRVGYYTWTAAVKDRAGNSRAIDDGSTPVDSVFMAIDELLPNITGIGFQTTLYIGGQPATFSFSANDDLELKDGQVTLTYGVGSATNMPLITYPYGSSAYTTGAFGAPFDLTFVNVLNGQPLTVGYYIANYDFTTATAFAAPATGNVAGFTSSGITNNVTANVRDVANQSAAAPLTAPMLATQLSARSGAPSYGSSMIDWRITSKAGGIIAVTHTGPTSSTVPYCERIDIYEANVGAVAGIVDAATTTSLTFRGSISASPTITDNGINRFWAYASGVFANVDGGFYTALCVKSGSGLFSNLF